MRPEAIAIYEGLPPFDYAANYQPDYPNQQNLLGGINELVQTRGVTTPRDVDNLRDRLAYIQANRIGGVFISGRCAEPVDAAVPIDRLAHHAISDADIVEEEMGENAQHIPRGLGQAGKPRTYFWEVEPDEHGENGIVSYMGDMINSIDPDRRTPDPTRMVSSAVQARDLSDRLAELTGKHVYAAHEALLLPYDQSFIRDGYLESADLPWIGMRTNAVDSHHVTMLAGTMNPVGIKIGANSTAEHIKQLHEHLNPEGLAGKEVYMVRVGLGQMAALATIAGSIKEYAPNALIMWDVHGITRTVEGVKVRSEDEAMQSIGELSNAFYEAGLALHGLNIETQPDATRRECVEHAYQRPRDPGGVDPQFSPKQFRSILRQTAAAGYLLRNAA
jgi:3-deoxy-7-phosphoheptulonate synthase